MKRGIELEADEKILWEVRYRDLKDRYYKNPRGVALEYIGFTLPFFIIFLFFFINTVLYLFGLALINLNDESDAYFLIISLSWGMFLTLIYTIKGFNSLRILKYDYPLILLTNKRIVMAYDFLKRGKTIGTFLNNAEKIIYKVVNPYRTDLIVYEGNQKKPKIIHLPNDWIDNLLEKLEDGFGDKLVVVKEENK